MFCGNCGKKLEEGVKFCGSCGSPVEGTKTVANRTDNNPVAYKNSGNMPEILDMANLGDKICFCILTVFNFICSKASMFVIQSDWFGSIRKFTFASAAEYAKKIAQFDEELNVMDLSSAVWFVNIGLICLVGAACLSFMKFRVPHILANVGTICNFLGIAAFMEGMVHFGGKTGLFEVQLNNFSLNLVFFAVINIIQLVITNQAFSGAMNGLYDTYYNKDYTLHDKEAGHDWKCPDCGRVNRGCIQMCSCGWVHKKGRA